MKNLLVFMVSCLLFLLSACSEDIGLTKRTDADLLKDVPIGTMDIGPVNPFVWTSLQVPQMNGYPFNNPAGNNIILSVNGNIFCGVGHYGEKIYKLNNSTKRWELFNGPSGTYSPFQGGHQYLWSYQSKFYYGLQLGYGGEDYVASRDPLTGQNVQVADFPGTPVTDPICFVIGSKGYLMGGKRNNFVSNQVWEYDFIADQWTNKGTMPGGARAGGSAFVRNNKVFFGLGYDLLGTTGGQWIRRYKDDWYEMTPGSNFAATKANFPGPKRASAKTFTINDKFYFGWGWNSSGYKDDFWEYDPSNNTWAQKTSCPVSNVDASNINVFSIGNAGYLVKGDLGSFYRYSNGSLIPVPQGL